MIKGEAYFVKSLKGKPWKQRDFLHLVYNGDFERVVNGEVVATYGKHTYDSAKEFASKAGYWGSYHLTA